MRTTETFEQHLRKSNLSENTIHSYLWTVDFYHAHYDEVNKENLLAAIGRFEAQLDEIKDAIQADDAGALCRMFQASTRRRELLEK